MLIAFVLMLATAPPFEPAREHEGSEAVEDSANDEELHDDSIAEPVPVAGGRRPPFLQYTLTDESRFEFFAPGLDDTGLARIVYPLYLPAIRQEADRPAIRIPERFDATREWLTQHPGEPDIFTSTEAIGPPFPDVDVLLELDTYAFNSTWCAEAANAYLIAQRERGHAPVLVASVESTELAPDPKDARMGQACPGDDVRRNVSSR